MDSHQNRVALFKASTVPVEKDRQRQYTLFEDIFGGTPDNVSKRGHPYSNSASLLYEQAPKFITNNHAKSYIEKISFKNKKILRFLENHTVNFVFEDCPYQLEITPATINRKNPETGNQEKTHLFPGFREKSVE